MIIGLDVYTVLQVANNLFPATLYLTNLKETNMLSVPQNWEKIVNGIRYRVATATLLADNQYWDGRNHERNGRNHFLYRTPKGRYFLVTLTMWQGEQNTLEPISEDEAVALYEGELTEHAVDWETAFPERTIEEA